MCLDHALMLAENYLAPSKCTPFATIIGMQKANYFEKTNVCATSLKGLNSTKSCETLNSNAKLAKVSAHQFKVR